MRNGSLWSNVAVEKDVIFQQNIWIEFETSQLRSRVQGIWKHITCATRVFFLPFFSRNFGDQLSSTFHRFVMLICICWDTLVRILVFDNYQRCPVPLMTMFILTLQRLYLGWFHIRQIDVIQEQSSGMMVRSKRSSSWWGCRLGRCYRTWPSRLEVVGMSVIMRGVQTPGNTDCAWLFAPF